MSGIEAIMASSATPVATGEQGAEAVLQAAQSFPADNPAMAGGAGQGRAVQQATFADLMTAGLERVEAKIGHADEMSRRFALDDGVPVHQVTIALEEARLAVELAMQVRTRLVEGYREIMNMQL